MDLTRTRRGRAPWAQIAVPLLALLAAFALRAHALGAQSLWFDEGWSWHLARMPWSQMVGITAGDRSPIGYYSLLRAWITFGGDSEHALRLLSTLADVCTCALLIAFARVLGARPIWPALAWAVSPLAVWYAQEARMYALLAACGAGSAWALWLWLRRGRARWLAATTLLWVAAVHTHYYGIFLLPGLLGAVWLGGRWPEVRAHALSVAAGLLLVLPWLWFARGGFGYSDGFAAPLNTIDGRLREFAEGVIGGGYGWPVPAWALAALRVLLSLAFALAWRAARLRQQLMLAALALLPVLAAAIAVRLFFSTQNVFHPRYLIFAAPLIGLLLAPAARAGALPVALFALLLGATSAQQALAPKQRDDVRGAVAHVLEALQPGDAIVMSRDNFAVRYYDRAGRVGFAAPDGLHGVLRDDARLLADLNRAPVQRVRLLLWQDTVVDPQTRIEQLLRANGHQVGELSFGQIRLPLYAVSRWPLQAPQFTPVARAFEGGPRLTGFNINPNPARSNLMYVTLRWVADPQPIALDYKVFVHIVDSAGVVRFQQDKRPLNDLLPMSTWHRDPGVVLDAYAMVIPQDAPGGRYTLRIGIYDPDSGVRLRSGAEDALDLVSFDLAR